MYGEPAEGGQMVKRASHIESMERERTVKRVGVWIRESRKKRGVRDEGPGRCHGLVYNYLFMKTV